VPELTALPFDAGLPLTVNEFIGTPVKVNPGNAVIATNAVYVSYCANVEPAGSPAEFSQLRVADH
jgi:hypothetical protein